MPKMLDDSYNPHSGKRTTWEMFANKLKLKKGWNKVRIYGLVYTDARHNNIKTKSGKAYNEYCLGWDVDNDTWFADRADRCDCCRLEMPHQQRKFVNALDIDEWGRRPAVPGSDWNPIGILEMSPNLHDQIMALKTHPLNTTGANIGDPKRGALIGINYNPDAPSPAQVYSVSIIQAGFQFDEAMLKFEFEQNTPSGGREQRKSNGAFPAAWVYYPCRNSKEDMRRSLKNHGYFGDTGSGGGEATAAVEAKGKALLGELSSLVKEGDGVPKGGVAQLAKLREESSNGADQTPPPKAAAKTEEPPVADQIPF